MTTPVTVNVNLPTVDLKPLTDFGKFVAERIYRATGVEARRIREEGKAKDEARLLKAETDAAILLKKADTEIELREKYHSSALRMMHTAVREDDNINSITEKMLLLLPDHKPEGDGPTDDTINNIFDHGKKDSTDEMQSVWANLLAGEFSKPGSFSKQTINIVGNMESKDAHAFAGVCRFVWQKRQTIRIASVGLQQDNVARRNYLPHRECAPCPRSSPITKRATL